MNQRRLLAIATKETLQIWRDPRSLGVALAMLLLQILLGYGLNLNINHVPLCIYDQANTQTSRRLVQSFVASGWLSPVRYLHSDSDVRAAMKQGKCLSAVTIPSNFSRALTTTGRVQVQAIFDATDTNTTNVAIGYAQGIIAQTSADFETRWAWAHGHQVSSVGAVDLQPRVWFNEGLESRNFLLPGVIAIVLAMVGAQLTSLIISREWERGTMERLISTPVTALEVMLGKLIPYFTIGLFDAVLSVVLAIFWFQVPFHGDIITLTVATTFFIAVVLSIGLFLSVSIKSQVGASQLALVLTLLPATLLSGFAFTIEQMPAPIRALTVFIYARYYVEILRSVFLKGSSLLSLSLPISALAIYAVVILWITGRRFRKRLD
jgi:drug efflux transport system permease protein